MPSGSTTSIFCCQTLSSSLELLEFKAAAAAAAACFKQNVVWDNGCSQFEQFCSAGKPAICQWVSLSLNLLEWNFTVLHNCDWRDSYPSRYHNNSPKFFHCLTPDLFLHLNVMLFKLSYSPLINNEWRLTVCLVKSSVSNVSALLKGAVDQGEKNLLHKCNSLTIRPSVCINISKYLL